MGPSLFNNNMGLMMMIKLAGCRLSSRYPSVPLRSFKFDCVEYRERLTVAKKVFCRFFDLLQ